MSQPAIQPLLAPAAPTTLSDEEVVTRVLAGDSSLYEILMRRYNKRLFRIAPPAPSAPVLCSSAPAPVEQVNLAGGVTAKAVCIADCGMFDADVSCNYVSSCTAVDESCPGEQGHVICDGVVKWCPTCCTNGHIRNVTTGPTCSCEDGQSTPKDHYKCVNNQWGVPVLVLRRPLLSCVAVSRR